MAATQPIRGIPNPDERRSVLFVVVTPARKVFLESLLFHFGRFGLQLARIDRLDDCVVSTTPAQQVNLTAALAAEWEERRCLRRLGGNYFGANRAGWRSYHRVLPRTVIEWHHSLALDFDAGFDSDFDSVLPPEPLSDLPPPSAAFLSASAAFLYAELR